MIAEKTNYELLSELMITYHSKMKAFSKNIKNRLYP